MILDCWLNLPQMMSKTNCGLPMSWNKYELSLLQEVIVICEISRMLFDYAL